MRIAKIPRSHEEETVIYITDDKYVPVETIKALLYPSLLMLLLWMAFMAGSIFQQDLWRTVAYQCGRLNDMNASGVNYCVPEKKGDGVVWNCTVEKITPLITNISSPFH